MGGRVDKHLEAIRDRNLPTKLFREHSLALADYLMSELLSLVTRDKRKDVVPIIIFRASLVFMPVIYDRLPASSIGFLGLKRDERTAIAELYYVNIPRLSPDSIIVIFDPMLGTCGTLARACQEVNLKAEKDFGRPIGKENFYFVGFLAAQSGWEKALQYVPAGNIVLSAVDPILDANNYISPGLGDFGDRFVGQ